MIHISVSRCIQAAIIKTAIVFELQTKSESGYSFLYFVKSPTRIIAGL